MESRAWTYMYMYMYMYPNLSFHIRDGVRNFKLLKFGNLVERSVCMVHLVAIGQFPIP